MEQSLKNAVRIQLCRQCPTHFCALVNRNARVGVNEELYDPDSPLIPDLTVYKEGFVLLQDRFSNIPYFSFDFFNTHGWSKKIARIGGLF